MSADTIRTILEDVADNLFNPDPYYLQGGDLVRVGGVSYSIDLKASAGRRIGDLTLLKTGKPLDPAKEYVVTGWASVNEGTEGPAIWDVVMRHIEKNKTVAPRETGHVRVVGN
jgi:sulfur-oxidizing protein SoxB